MYERFYELRERPFALSPDPDYLYPSRVHREALDYLRYGLESHAGFVVITGEIGSGKTTLLQTLLRGIDSQTTVGRVVNTLLEPRELLETIMIDFGLDPAGKSKPLILRDLAQYLVDQRLAGRMVLLVIDEAQNLSPAALEELRMLSNLETEKSKLLQIVLVGQPNLREKLGSADLEQLRQRITVSYHLLPLDEDETEKYINHRLHRAALGTPVAFPRDATDAVHARSRGVPRIVNVICDAALVFGYAEERRAVDLALVQEVLAELESTGVLPPVGFTNMTENPPPPVPVPAPADTARALPSSREAGFSRPAHVEAGFSRPADVPAKVEAGFSRPADMLRQDVMQRSAQLDQREQALRQRERELAEQRRILAEEYRLLRTRTAAPSHAEPPRSIRVQVQSPVAMRTDRPQSLWQRVKRLMLGASSPAME